MGELLDIQGGQIAGARLAAASVTKTATSSAVSRAAVRQVGDGIHRSRDDIIS